jgi:hypothetical protein
VMGSSGSWIPWSSNCTSDILILFFNLKRKNKNINRYRSRRTLAKFVKLTKGLLLSR